MTDHGQRLADGLAADGHQSVIPRGGLGAKASAAAKEPQRVDRNGPPLLVVATRRGARLPRHPDPGHRVLAQATRPRLRQPRLPRPSEDDTQVLTPWLWPTKITVQHTRNIGRQIAVRMGSLRSRSISPHHQDHGADLRKHWSGGVGRGGIEPPTLRFGGLPFARLSSSAANRQPTSERRAASEWLGMVEIRRWNRCRVAP